MKIKKAKEEYGGSGNYYYPLLEYEVTETSSVFGGRQS